MRSFVSMIKQVDISEPPQESPQRSFCNDDMLNVQIQ
jgi:hypothetical protein